MGCKTNTEIELYIAGKTLFLGVLNYYFDTEDYESPIKYRFEGQYDWPILPSFTLGRSVRIAKNIAYDKTSYWPFASTKKYEHYSVDKIFETTAPMGTNNVFINISLDVSDTYVKIERTVFSLIDMISTIGGLVEIYVIAGMLVSSTFTDKIYFSKLLSQLYQVRSEDSASKLKRKWNS